MRKLTKHEFIKSERSSGDLEFAYNAVDKVARSQFACSAFFGIFTPASYTQVYLSVKLQIYFFQPNSQMKKLIWLHFCCMRLVKGKGRT